MDWWRACRTEPLPSPFTKPAAAARLDTAAGAATRLGPAGAAGGEVQALSMEVDMRPTADDAPGPPTASQSLEPATSIPDKIMIGQRARRATRVGKHGAADPVSVDGTPHASADGASSFDQKGAYGSVVWVFAMSRVRGQETPSPRV